MSTLLDVRPNETARQLTGRSYLSYTAISTFQACPLKWHFKYRLGLAEESVSVGLVFGGAIHRAVEHHFRELQAGNSAPDLDTLLTSYQAAWQDRDPGNVQFGKGEDERSLVRVAERVLAAFQRSPFARPDGRIVGIEEELCGPIAAGCPDLLARVDLLVDAGDALVVTDLKTARSRWSQQQAELSAEQLLLYSELIRQLSPGKPVRLQFAVVTKTQSPVVEGHPIAVEPQRIERTKRVVERTWQAMQAGHIYPAPSPLNCPGCPFRNACRSWSP